MISPENPAEFAKGPGDMWARYYRMPNFVQKIFKPPLEFIEAMGSSAVVYEIFLKHFSDYPKIPRRHHDARAVSMPREISISMLARKCFEEMVEYETELAKARGKAWRGLPSKVCRRGGPSAPSK